MDSMFDLAIELTGPYDNTSTVMMTGVSQDPTLQRGEAGTSCRQDSLVQQTANQLSPDRGCQGEESDPDM